MTDDLPIIGAPKEASPEEQKKQQEYAEAVQNSMRKELTTKEFEILGVDDSNLKRVVSFMKISNTGANAAKLRVLSDAQIYGVFKKEFEKHAERIGWYPDGDGPDFVIKQMDEGSWLGVMKSKRSLFQIGARSWESFPRVGVDTRGKKDV